MSEIDVAIVGGGAAGMVAALRAARNPNLTVVVFEKSTAEWCNTQVSSGSLAAGGTRFQREAGVDDSPQRHSDDIVSVSKDESTRHLVDAVCQVAPHYVEWLADDLGYPMEIGLDMPRGGQSVPRLHTDVAREGGQFLVRFLRDAIAATPNIAFVDRTPGIGLLHDDCGVVGVRVRESSGDAEVTARAVVLAADGFAANAAMLSQHCPEATDDYFSGVSTSTGDALQWAIELGAATRNMASFLGHGLIVPGHGTRLNPSLPHRGALLVNARGQRFVDEHAHGYSSLGAVMRGLPQRRAFILWPTHLHDDVMQSELMRQSAEAGAFALYESVTAVSEALGIRVDELRRTLADFVAHDSVTGRTFALSFPLFAAPITTGILVTQGGLEVDAMGRVLNAGGAAIPGLFAGGGTAMGISGPDSRGYSSGNGLLSAFGLGWIIGNGLAEA